MQQSTRYYGLSGFAWLAIILVVIGAINWGLVGLFNVDLVATLFGTLTAVSRIVYVLVALAGLYLLYVAARIGSRRNRI